MHKQTLLLMLWTSMVPCGLGSYFGQQQTLQIKKLLHNEEQIFSVTKRSNYVYHIKAITSPAYVLGSTCVGVHLSSGEFDIKFQENLESFGNDSSSWYQVLSGVCLSNALQGQLSIQWYVMDGIILRQSFNKWNLHSVNLGDWACVSGSKPLQGLSRWLSKKSNRASGYSQTYCFSPYKEMYFIVRPHSNQDGSLRITARHMVLDLTCCIRLVCGLLLFYKAPQLSKSMTFYYTSGTGLGILASALIFVFILSRFLPKKAAAYSVLLGGWSLCGVVLSKLWSNITEVMINYYQFVIGYAFISGFVSFGICYRYGTVTDPRSHNLIQWTIQIFSLLLVYSGTQLTKVSLTIVMMLVIHRSVTNSMTLNAKWDLDAFKLKKIDWFKWPFGRQPQPRRFLTEEEYQLEGMVETEKALEELRKFCHSPKCSPWKTLSKIESPKRFAQFADGDNHLLDAEITLHEETIDNLSETEDDQLYVGDYSLMSEDDDSLEL